MSVTTKTAYLTVDDANRYFAGRLETDIWDASTPSDQLKALIQATTAIDRLAFLGVKEATVNEHEFPRLYRDQQFDQWIYDSDGVPLDVKYAVCEQAAALLAGFNVETEVNGLNILQKSFSQNKVWYDNTSCPMHVKAGLCVSAWQFLLPFVRDQRDVMLTRVS